MRNPIEVHRIKKILYVTNKLLYLAAIDAKLYHEMTCFYLSVVTKARELGLTSAELKKYSNEDPGEYVYKPEGPDTISAWGDVGAFDLKNKGESK